MGRNTRSRAVTFCTNSPPPRLQRQDVGLPIAPAKVVPKKKKQANEYFIEKILDKRIQDGVVEYRIKWYRYPMTECTWEPAQHLSGAQEAVEEFEAALDASESASRPPKRKNVQTQDAIMGCSEDEEVVALPTVSRGTRARDAPTANATPSIISSPGKQNNRPKKNTPQKRTKRASTTDDPVDPIEPDNIEVSKETRAKKPRAKAADRRSSSPPAAPVAILFVRPGSPEPQFLTEFADCTRAWLSAGQAENMCLTLAYRFILPYIDYAAVNRHSADPNIP